MEELRTAREDTKKTREDLGALESRAIEKRKREIEERRAVLVAKRRKTRGGVRATGLSSISATPPATFVTSNPFAALEKKSTASSLGTPELQRHTLRKSDTRTLMCFWR